MTVKKNRLLIALGVTLILMLFTNCALGYTATPYADTVFSSAKVSLSAQINASFTAQTKSKQAEIKVTSCILQIKTGSVWADSMTLTAPSKVATNANRYTASKNYSSSCSSGNTYRIKAVFDADGHTKTTYSNSISY